MKVKLLRKLRRRLRICQLKHGTNSYAAQEKRFFESSYAWHSIRIGTFPECLSAIHSKIHERLKKHLDAYSQGYKKIIKF